MTALAQSPLRTVMISTLALAGALAAIPAQTDASVARDAAVYTAVFAKLFGSDSADGKLLVVMDTADGSLPSTVRRRLQAEGVDSVALSDLAQRATLRVDLRSRAPSATRALRFISRADVPTGARNADEFWRAFYDRFPTAMGRIKVSAVGYSRDAKQGVLLVEQGRGGRNATLWFVVVAQVGSSWNVVRAEAIGGA